jgi:phosphoglycolate phosphatase-like HAD superfamily hydrolase
MRVEELVTERDHVLVAFDGPVAGLPPRGPMTDRLRIMVAGGRLPRKVARTADPMVVLAYAATIGPATGHAVHTQLRRIEYELVAGARITPGVREACATMAAAGTQLTVISGLAADVTRTFLVLHGLQEHVRYVVGRAGPDPTGLPPAPDLITSAIHERAIPLRSCLFVGTTDADLAAARAAGVDTIRHGPTAAASQRWFDALTGWPCPEPSPA